jgi:hypothetical protein
MKEGKERKITRKRRNWTWVLYKELVHNTGRLRRNQMTDALRRHHYTTTKTWHTSPYSKVQTADNTRTLATTKPSECGHQAPSAHNCITLKQMATSDHTSKPTLWNSGDFYTRSSCKHTWRDLLCGIHADEDMYINTRLSGGIWQNRPLIPISSPPGTWFQWTRSSPR